MEGLKTIFKSMRMVFCLMSYFSRPRVVTGYRELIAPSGIWLPKPANEAAVNPVPLESFDSNWSTAERSPEVAMRLVEKEIDEGFVMEFIGSEEDARKKWKDVSIGKLNIVHATGKDDRLTLDSSVTLLNPQLGIQEKTFPPGPRDVEATAPEAEADSSHLSFTADVKSAHKFLRLRPDQQGQCMFRLMHRLFFYLVCHLGGGFSDYWWKRFSAFLIRWWHRLIYVEHRGFIYTDTSPSGTARRYSRL